MIKIKVLNESRKLLNEVSYDEAAKTLDGSKFTKKLIAVAGYAREYSGDYAYSKKNDEKIAEETKQWILNTIPIDIPDNSRGLSLLWLKQRVLDDPQGFYGTVYLDVKRALERFFQYNGSRQMPNFIRPAEKKDLNRIEKIQELLKIVDDAWPRYKTYLEDQENKNADKGTEKIYDGPEWTISIAHNKGAACELGKGTSWCTAAPGLDYFQHYSTPDNPLFIFINKKNPSEKYQFHYGTNQFMNKNDEPIRKEPIFHELDNLLRKVPGIQKRYPKIGFKLGNKIIKKVKHGNITDYYADNNIIMTKIDNGDIIHFDGSGNKHREGAPAVYNKYEYEKDPENAPQLWYHNGDTHRSDGGPAEINDKGTKFWVIANFPINIDPNYEYGGPNIIKSDGQKIWKIGTEFFTSEDQFKNFIENPSDNYDREEADRYLSRLKHYRNNYLVKRGLKAIKENKKFVIKIKSRN